MTRWIRLLGPLFAFGLLLSACGDDSSGADSSGSDDSGSSCDADICLVDISYSPDALTVSGGDVVTWSNVDGTDHTVTADDGAFDSGTLSDGDSFEFTFESSGTFAFHCEIHSSMTGTITVE
jgi:plastocyanin